MINVGDIVTNSHVFCKDTSKVGIVVEEKQDTYCVRWVKFPVVTIFDEVMVEQGLSTIQYFHKQDNYAHLYRIQDALGRNRQKIH